MPRLVTHAVAALGAAYLARALATARGWRTVAPAGERDDMPALSIVVPARNEERSIECCVRSLIAQRGLEVEVIVVDDRSDDATPHILAALQVEFPQLRVVHGAALPQGWVGKPWACAQGAKAARGAWLLFTDADSEHEPHAAISTLAHAIDARVDVLSLITGQVLESWPERAILPTILGMVAFVSGSLEAINDPARPERALANGQFILAARAAYEALGGHGAVRGEIAEDLEFARLIKSDGRFRFVLVVGTRLVRVRMYHSFREIWDGFTKNVYVGARGDIGALAGGVAFCTLLSVVPPVLALAALRRGRSGEALEALAVTATVMAVAADGARRMDFPRTLGIYAPIGLATFAAIMFNSSLRGVTGRGFAWRGRTYGARSRKAASPGPNEDV